MSTMSDQHISILIEWVLAVRSLTLDFLGHPKFSKRMFVLRKVKQNKDPKKEFISSKTLTSYRYKNIIYVHILYFKKYVLAIVVLVLLYLETSF